MPAPPSSTPPRSTSKGFFSQSNRTTRQAKDVQAGVNPSPQSSSSHSLPFRRGRGRQHPHTHDGTVRNRPPPVATREVAVQTSSSSPLPSPTRTRWGSLLAPTKSATLASVAQPKSPPVVEPPEDQRLPRVLYSQHSPKHSPFTKKFLPGNPRLRSRASSVDSWRVPFDQTKSSDRSSITPTVPPPLNLTTDARNPAAGHSTSFKTQNQDPSSSSSSSALNPSSMSSAMARLASLEISGRSYLSWRGTSSPQSTSMVPAFALTVAPPSLPPRLSPTSSPPPARPPVSSISDSHSINSFETASSNPSTLRSKRRGKRSKHHKDGKGSEATSSPTTSSSSG